LARTPGNRLVIPSISTAGGDGLEFIEGAEESSGVARLGATPLDRL